MLVKYADVKLPVPKDDLCEWVERELPRIEEGEFAEQVWPGQNLLGLTFPGYVNRLPSRINKLHWPIGASRFAVGRFLASDSQVQAIRESIYTETSAIGLQAAVFRMEAENSYIETQLYLLPPRPLFRKYDSEGLNLLTLVDQRYMWWFKRGTVSVTETVTTWDSLLTQLEVLLEIDIQRSDIDAAYLYPSSVFATQYEALPLLLDAVAYNIGHKILCDLDGYIYSLNLDDAKEKLRELLDAGRDIQAGGFLALEA